MILFQGPNNVYRAWVGTGKRSDDAHDVLALCEKKVVRFGAYGDPAHIPAWLATEIMGVSAGWTAYTHQWRDPVVAKNWKGKAMASCDTVAQLRIAESKGWAAFVATPDELDGVNICDNEVNGTQCIDCLRCNGAQGSVQTQPHGARVKSHPSMKRN